MPPAEAEERAPTREAAQGAARAEPSDARAWLRMALAAPKLLPFAVVSPARQVRAWARRAPDALALAFEERRLRWRDVDREADRWARWLLREGVGRGDVVAMMMDNRPEFLVVFTALSRVGAVAALINTQVKGAGLTHALAVSDAKLSICGSEHVDAMLEACAGLPRFVPDKQLVVQRDPAAPDAGAGLRVVDDELDRSADPQPVPDARLKGSDLCCYVYTSGTTGLPKAAVIRNQRMLGGGFTFGHLMHRATPGDLVYVALPLYHSSALFLGWGAALATGAAIGLRRHFSASGFWSDVERWRATSFLYIGEMCRYLLESPERAEERRHSLRAAVGNGMRPDLWRPFQERFDVPVVREFYGATEGNAPLLNVSGRPGMIGRMSRGQAVVRCDPTTGEPERGPDGFCQRALPGETGLLLGRISRALAFDGYVDREATKKKIRSDVFARGDRYFDTGDLVRLWEGRWLSFADRVGDTFRWKGENVSTLEVAAAIGRAPGVRDVSVYGVEIPGTEGRACMCALRLDRPPDFDALSAHFERELAPYQRPLFVRVLEGPLRTTGTFKQQTASYRKEGFDPGKTDDEIRVSREGRFEPCDAETYRAICDGTFVPS